MPAKMTSVKLTGVERRRVLDEDLQKRLVASSMTMIRNRIATELNTIISARFERSLRSAIEALAVNVLQHERKRIADELAVVINGNWPRNANVEYLKSLEARCRRCEQ
jgi:hypothetical protein